MWPPSFHRDTSWQERTLVHLPKQVVTKWLSPARCSAEPPQPALAFCEKLITQKVTSQGLSYPERMVRIDSVPARVGLPRGTCRCHVPQLESPDSWCRGHRQTPITTKKWWVPALAVGIDKGLQSQLDLLINNGAGEIIKTVRSRRH